MSPGALPVHGFVLAGGASTRMGTDKALLRFCGRPLVQIAVEKLQGFCAEVAIAGNRDDLAAFAPVVHETRTQCGPAAGIEAGLRAASQPWALFIPVDVPLVPMEALRAWVEQTIEGNHEQGSGSYLRANGVMQPAFCLLRPACLTVWTRVLDTGQRRLASLLRSIGGTAAALSEPAVLAAATPELASDSQSEAASSASLAANWFANVNTPQELAEAETWRRLHS